MSSESIHFRIALEKVTEKNTTGFQGVDFSAETSKLRYNVLEISASSDRDYVL